MAHQSVSSDTPLEPVEESVGRVLRQRRRARRLTLRQASSEAGISEGFLSQIERGVHNGSVATLRRLSEVLGLRVTDLFDETEKADVAVVRHSFGGGLRYGHGVRKTRLTPSYTRDLEIFLGKFDPSGTTDEPYRHGASDELIVALSGAVDITVGPLDTATFSSSLPHRVTEVHGDPVQILWAIAPPNY